MKLETKVTRVDIFQKNMFKNSKSFGVVFICIKIRSWRFCIKPMLFCGIQDSKNEILESSTSLGWLDGWVYFNHRTANLTCSLIVEPSNGKSNMLSYCWCKLSWKRINELYKDLVVLETLGFVLKAGICHFTRGKNPEKTEVRKWVLFLLFSDILLLQYQVRLPRWISTPSNGGSKCHHGF
jgi:hypothetical protein